jgi:SAM-dependent methyltransferase
VSYDVESYWSGVAKEIRNRTSGEFVAGDDDPFHRYKREKFVREFLPKVEARGKRVLELGCGPGGNLQLLASLQPAELIGIDISDSMLALAGDALHGRPVTLKKTDGQTLPLEDARVDLAYTVTVLQHNVDSAQLDRMATELARVTTDRIMLFEDIGTTTSAPPGASYITRPVDAYRAVFAAHGFQLTSAAPLGLRVSRIVRKIVGRVLLRGHHEGEPIGRLARSVLRISLPITARLDRIVPDNGDVTMMVFERA